MSAFQKDFVFLMLQFLDEVKYKHTSHKLECESGYFFNMNYFEECVTKGDWDEVENYLSGFTEFNDDRYSAKIFFDIRKQKYLEALDRKDKPEALEVLVNGLKVFTSMNPDVFKELTSLLTLANIRENENLSAYGPNPRANRAKLFVELKRVISASPLFHGKLQFPNLESSRIQTLINQSLNWQHLHCKNPQPNPVINTLFVDHTCVLPSGSLTPSKQSISQVYRSRSAPALYPAPGNAHALCTSEDLPKTVVVSLNQGSTVKSMDFHPSHVTYILVGTNTGDVALWDIGSRERLVSKTFKVWDLASCSVVLQTSLGSEYSVSVNRVKWSPDGSLFGVAYSKHIVQVFAHCSGEDLQNHLEIDAHVGNVYDLAFSHPNEQQSIVTCGEDKTIKVWDAASGAKRYTFEGHESPVYSVCPHHNKDFHFIYSTDTDGIIKTWLYDKMVLMTGVEAPGRSCTMMAYSTDGTRLFSCGTSKDGESHMVEWNERGAVVKRAYHGLSKQSVGIVQFDTAKNRFLAAGDAHVIKFWDMDKTDLLTTVDAEGGLQESPSLRFSKDGVFLAVSTNENGIKILANPDGVQMLRSIEALPLDDVLKSNVASTSANMEVN